MRLVPLLFVSAIVAVPALATPQLGAPAPNFSLTDASGKTIRLADYRGKTVVLEWNNPGCPFVQKHYDSGNMQKTQAAARREGAVWFTINSGAPGKQGHMSPAQARAFVASKKAQPTAYLLDANGVAGKGYEAKTTPEMFVISPQGRLVYMGAIDDKPSADIADIATARNHVLAALGEMKAGKAVSVARTRGYGCSVKYAS